jgi:hypothetical protein
MTYLTPTGAYDIESWVFADTLDKPFIYARSVINNQSTLALTNSVAAVDMNHLKFNTHAMFFSLYSQFLTHETETASNVSWHEAIESHLNANYTIEGGKIVNKNEMKEPVVTRVVPPITAEEIAAQKVAVKRTAREMKVKNGAS